jgi:GNAT superfamily N-acetyltransferase
MNDSGRQPVSEVRWVEGNCPGLVGEIVRWHGLYYVRDLGWAPVFEILCADQLAQIARHFDARDDVAAFSAWSGDQFLAAAVMDARPGTRAGARLRFFIASNAARGRGIGGQLLQRAIAWSEGRGDSLIWLTTVAGLPASSHLYRKLGFSVVEEHLDTSWGSQHREQLWERPRRT